MLLLRSLGLDQVLHYGIPCPNRTIVGADNTNNNNNNVSHVMILLSDPEDYRKYDSQLMTMAWKQAFWHAWEPGKKASAWIQKQQQQQQHPASPNETAAINQQPFRIVAHIRRGDVGPCFKPKRIKHWSDLEKDPERDEIIRYLSNDYYQNLMDQYSSSRRVGHNQTVSITVHSEAHSFENFSSFQQHNDNRNNAKQQQPPPKIEYHLKLDDELTQVWYAILTADVVLLGRSSFGFVPAILAPRNATIVYTPFWHQPNPEWLHHHHWQVVDVATRNRENEKVLAMCRRSMMMDKQKEHEETQDLSQQERRQPTRDNYSKRPRGFFAKASKSVLGLWKM